MDAIEALVRSLPADADRIRRRFWRDEEFRTVCEDHRDAVEALNLLEVQQLPNEVLITEYRQLVEELRSEAALWLRKA